MDKILEALKKMLPSEDLADVTEAIKAQMASELEAIKAEKDKEYTEKLEEAYADLSKELETAEATGVEGYQQARAIIEDLRKRLDRQQVEFTSTMNANYEEAFQMLQAEKAKNENIEVEMYEKFSEKLEEMRQYMIDKITNFLEYKTAEIYEAAQKDLVNDARFAGPKVALDKVVESVAEYIEDTDYAAVSNSKLQEALEQVKDLQSQMKLMEARNIKLNQDNQRLNESVRQKQQVITENTDANKQERAKKAQNATGRGRAVSDPEQIVAEWKNPMADVKPVEQKADTTLVESLDPEFLRQMQVLAGTKIND